MPGANRSSRTMPTGHDDDARLLMLATAAVDAIEARLMRGEAAETVVASVVNEAFALTTDPAVVDRVVATVLDIIAGGG